MAMTAILFLKQEIAEGGGRAGENVGGQLALSLLLYLLLGVV